MYKKCLNGYILKRNILKKNNVSYKQVLKDASPEYKKRDKVKTEKPSKTLV